MADRTTTVNRSAVFVSPMTDQMRRRVQTMSAWIQSKHRPLQEIAAQVVRVMPDLGNSLLAALIPLAAPIRPSPDVPCACGQSARFQRIRAATVTTVLGRMTVEQALSACPHCGARQAPLDQQVPIAAGGFSLDLPERLVLLDATQDTFAQARAVLARLVYGPYSE